MTEIPNSCFSYNSITELSIPATVTTIGSGAFAYNNISTLSLNEGLIKIGNFAFGNNRLISVSIPNSVVSIDEITFTRNQITEVHITNKVRLGGGAFANNKIVTVNGATSDGLFYKRNGDGTIDKTKLTSYGGTKSVIDFLSNDITEIDNYAFRNSLPATGIDLPNTGTWHTAYNYTIGTEVSKIESSNVYYHNHRVYLVNFVDHDATVLKTETLLHGSSATAPTNPTRTGYTFTAWDVAFDNVIEDMTVTAKYDVVTSIDKNKETVFKVYPNPVKDVLYVELSDEKHTKTHKVAIYNISGQLMYSISESGLKMSVSVANWDAGTYFIIVNNKRSKFIKL